MYVINIIWKDLIQFYSTGNNVCHKDDKVMDDIVFILCKVYLIVYFYIFGSGKSSFRACVLNVL